MDYAPTTRERYNRQQITLVQEEVNSLGLSREERFTKLKKALQEKFPNADFSNLKTEVEKRMQMLREQERPADIKEYRAMKIGRAQDKVGNLSEPERTEKLKELLSQEFPGTDFSNFGVRVKVSPEIETITPSNKETLIEQKESNKVKLEKIKQAQEKVKGLTGKERAEKLIEELEKSFPNLDFKAKAEKIFGEVAKAIPAKRKEELEKILVKDYGVKKDSALKKLLNKLIPKTSGGKIFAVAAPFVLAAFLYTHMENKNDNNLTDPDEFKKELPKTPTTPPALDSTTTSVPGLEPDPTAPGELEPLFPKRTFNKDVFESLPPSGQELYMHYYKNDPTPGGRYGFLDKDKELIYIFDASNNLVAKITPAFGKTPGDKVNNSFKGGFNEKAPGYSGTTPAGGYWFYNQISAENLREYDGLGINLIGITIENKPEFLGMHQTPHDEITKTERAISDPNIPNTISNGCIRIPRDIYIKYIAPFSIGDDFNELFYILGDKHSRKAFNSSEVIGRMMPKALEQANFDYKELSKSIEQNMETNRLIIAKAEQEIKDMEARGDAKEKIEGKKRTLERDKDILTKEKLELKKAEARIEAARKNSLPYF